MKPEAYREAAGARGPAAEEFDVIVIGGGGSGLAAAAASAQVGARVLVLERQLQLGGTTRLAVGSITRSEERRVG